MPLIRFSQQATIEFTDLADLLSYWRRFRDCMVVGTYVLKGTITPSQLRRLPKALQRMLVHDGVVASRRSERNAADFRKHGLFLVKRPVGI